MSSMIERCYSLPCGDVEFATDSEAIVRVLDAKTGAWAFKERGQETASLRFSLLERKDGAPCPLPLSAVLIYTNQILPGVSFEYFRNGRQEIFRVGGTDLIVADYERGVAEGTCSLTSPAWDGEYVFNCVVLPILIEWLSRHKMYAFHGGAVVDGKQAIVLCGASGQGKTTAVMSLSFGGFQLLTDDIGLLMDSEAGLKIRGLPEPVNLCADATTLFARLAPLQTEFDGAPKKAFAIERLLGGPPVSEGTPRLLLFPEIAPESQTRVAPISRGDAVDLLLPCCLFLTGMIEGCARFEAFLRLIETTRPMRLILGRNMDVLPGLVRAALSEGSSFVASQF